MLPLNRQCVANCLPFNHQRVANVLPVNLQRLAIESPMSFKYDAIESPTSCHCVAIIEWPVSCQCVAIESPENVHNLVKKNLEMYLHIIIVRLLVFWHSHQQMFVKWGNVMSSVFTVSNGVRQGGVLALTIICLTCTWMALVKC